MRMTRDIDSYRRLLGVFFLLRAFIIRIEIGFGNHQPRAGRTTFGISTLAVRHVSLPAQRVNIY